ncbi:hypothetical protein Sango_1609100 [Sesamum angolense]|uniref:DUF4283 domain-containing protein n=1 Tax=Sesamum angolense TaxID=2727404 RepID=A0AAE2BR54_9LAMI|nr:hypothetical protein Sango_1609100 [Sesamum angolense]
MLNPVKGIEMRNLAEGRFLIHFDHIINRNEALEGCPWSFDKNTNILSGIGVYENPHNVDLDWCKFFIHIHDMPLSKMNLGVATIIGNKLGKLCDMDMENSGAVVYPDDMDDTLISISIHFTIATRVSTMQRRRGQRRVVRGGFTSHKRSRVQLLWFEACATLGWCSKFHNARVETANARGSYHNPLIINLESTSDQGLLRRQKLFRFEAMWSRTAKCENLVRK